jgi:hypothetical protein
MAAEECRLGGESHSGAEGAGVLLKQGLSLESSLSPIVSGL